MLKTKFSITAASIALLALGSCKKETTITTNPEPDATIPTMSKTISGSMNPYDYTQSMGKIYKDATGNEASTTGTVFILPGKFYSEDKNGVVCEMTAGICSICFTEKRKHKVTTTSGHKSISGGTAETPIGFIKATTYWPEYVPAQEVNYEEGGQTASITILPIEG